MTYYIIKIAVTVVLVVLISEVAKRSSLIGAILASVPLVSVLGIMWLYIDTRDIGKITDLSTSIFWLVLPSLALFVTLPILLKREMNFYLSMGLSIAVTVLCYYAMIVVLGKFGIKL